jgi:hypothetical protein
MNALTWVVVIWLAKVFRTRTLWVGVVLAPSRPGPRPMKPGNAGRLGSWGDGPHHHNLKGRRRDFDPS